MARPKRDSPMLQGSLQSIYNWFIRPLIFYKPEDMSLTDWTDQLFHLKERDITQYVAKKNFKMPGLFYWAPMVKVQGLGFRAVKVGTQLMVRHDSRDNFWDVSFFGGPGEAELVYQLSVSEFGSVIPLLEEVLPRGMRKRMRKKQ